MSTERLWLVDDDADVREALAFLLRTADHEVETLASPDELLARITPEDAGCLVLDVRMPGMDGLELQAELARRGIGLPIVFVTGHGDIPMAVRAVAAGAVDFLEKPVDGDALLERVADACAQDRLRQRAFAEAHAVEAGLARLTPREREVMEGILAGRLNKTIADELGASVRTVEVHRARVLEKLGARNGAELVRLVLAAPSYAGWTPDRP